MRASVLPFVVAAALSAAALAQQSTPNFTVEGNQIDARLGRFVANAGDVNGDGYSDVIVAAPRFDAGQLDEGRVYVFLGTEAGTTGALAFVMDGNEIGAQFGFSAAGIGDYDGDGFCDVVIGAPYADDGSTIDEGRISLIRGGPTGLDPFVLWTWEGGDAGAHLGLSVANAGDVDGDGRSDFLAGAPDLSQGQAGEGRAMLFLGSLVGYQTGPNWSFEPDQAGAALGFSVAGVGDVDGDGFGEIAVGAPGFDTAATDGGRVFVFAGGANGPSNTASVVLDLNQAGAFLGYSVAAAGDVDADGRSDLVVGAPHAAFGQADEGAAFVARGTSTLALLSLGSPLGADQAAAQFGSSVSSAGDVNGDGRADVLVGAPLFDDAKANAGGAFVFLGVDGGVAGSASFSISSGQQDAHLGIAVSFAGDVNGDGLSDIVVGTETFDAGQVDEGKAEVFLGKTGILAEKPHWTANGGQSKERLGGSVAFAGDVNGDGFADVLGGARFFDSNQADVGRAVLFLGSKAGPSVVPDWEVVGTNAGERLGSVVAGAGDIDGDGFSDAIVGAPFANTSLPAAGVVHVHRGGSLGLAKDPTWTLEGDEKDGSFGAAAAGVGDVNGDGYSDIVVGAPTRDGATSESGRATLYLGGPNGLTLATTFVNEGVAAFDHCGSVVAPAGDGDADGFCDFFIGSPGVDAAFTDSGQYQLVRGDSSPAAIIPWIFGWYNQAGAEYGSALGAAGDVDNDGFSDELIGSPKIDFPNVDGGRVMVMKSGSPPAGTGMSVLFNVSGTQNDAHVGSALAYAGDVNGDGFDDFAIGADNANQGLAGEGQVQLFLGTGNGIPIATTPAWTRYSGQAGAHLGASLAGGGDVNGDGFSDLLLGVPDADLGQGSEGALWLFPGNAGFGAPHIVSQSRIDGGGTIAAGGTSPNDGFAMDLSARTFSGRGLVRLEWDVNRASVTIPESHHGGTAEFIDNGISPSGATAGGSIAGLVDGDYTWKARILLAPTSVPFQPHLRYARMPHANADPVDVRVAKTGSVLVVDDASPIAFTYVLGEPAPTPVLRKVENPGGSPLAWSVRTEPPVSWIDLPTSGGAALTTGNGWLSVPIVPDVTGLTPGIHSTSLVFENLADPSQDVVVPLEFVVGGPRFLPGDRLMATLTTEGDTTAASFDAIAGMTLKLKVSSAPLAIKALATVRGPNGEIVDAWLIDLVPGKSSKRSIVATQNGTHTLLLEAVDYAGSFQIATSRKLPKSALGFAKTLKGSSPSVAVLALPGAKLDANFKPKTGFTGPLGASLMTPSAQSFDASPFATSLPTGVLTWVALPLSEIGPFTITASGFGAPTQKVGVKVKITQPPLGTATIALP